MQLTYYIQFGEEERTINTEYGSPFVMSISYSPENFYFRITFNNDVLDDYELPSGTADISFSGINILGSVSVSFVGFTEPGTFVFMLFIIIIKEVVFHKSRMTNMTPYNTSINSLHKSSPTECGSMSWFLPLSTKSSPIANYAI